MKQTGMLVVSLRGVNFGFWSRLGCSGQSAIILKAAKVSLRVPRRNTELREEKQKSNLLFFSFFFFFFKRSLLGVKICLCHTQMVSFRG